MSDTIILTRKFYSDNSTIGYLVFDDFNCWILEPPSRKNGDSPVCIPSGTYKIEMRWSEKHQMEVPGLLNVPGRTDIEIHPGNFEQGAAGKDDSLGCLLPGDDYSTDFVSNSKVTFSKLSSLIQASLKEGDLFINITG